MQKAGVCVLGSTGSIGESTLKILKLHETRFEVIALTANTSIDRLFEQCCTYHPRYAVMTSPHQAALLAQKLKEEGCLTRVLSGETGLKEVTSIPEVDKVVSAIVGSAGLEPTLSAIDAKKAVILANKEPLVMAGPLLLAAAEKSGATLLPADSEHNAIFQCLPSDYRIGRRPKGVKKLILTASGGPFLNTPSSEFSDITPEMACQHPTWKMGKKITVDCATLMNKGLEVIEASRLFGMSADNIEVMVHPQSVVHSMVAYEDDSILAQLGPRDMRVPLTHCLAWPIRIPSGVKPLSLLEVGNLTFLSPDKVKFACLRLAYDALKLEGAAPIVLNASNEVAIDAFLKRQLKFNDIPRIIDGVLQQLYDHAAQSLIEIKEADKVAREKAYQLIHIIQKKSAC